MANNEGEIQAEERFRQSLRARREQRGWSMGELARRMVAEGWDDFHQATISRLEKGQRPIRVAEARTLARLLETSVSEMMAPQREQAIAMELAAAVDAAKDRERFIRGAAGGLDPLYLDLQLALKEAETLDPAIWQDPALRDRFEQQRNYARGRARMTAAGFLRSVVETIEENYERAADVASLFESQQEPEEDE